MPVEPPEGGRAESPQSRVRSALALAGRLATLLADLRGVLVLVAGLLGGGGSLIQCERAELPPPEQHAIVRAVDEALGSEWEELPQARGWFDLEPGDGGPAWYSHFDAIVEEEAEDPPPGEDEEPDPIVVEAEDGTLWRRK